MADYAQTATADSSGNCTLTFDGTAIPSGMQWIIAQITIETIPVRGSARCTVRRNGRYITSSIVGSGSSAQGPPYLLLNGTDTLSASWVGMQQGDECVLLLLYEQVPWGMTHLAQGII